MKSHLIIKIELINQVTILLKKTISNISQVSGITLKATSGGNGGTYIISFCSANPGSAIINEPGGFLFGTLVTWYIDSGTNTVYIGLQ